ncbi:PP2C family protein-serine/threonine phosphatase [Streptomyces longispororuber]|uniref:PP2C family protein-serine/threonine phosphatase n=1 Tax=Streptomyces longispororuber TaxID=68230 RepID=UPI0033ECACF5
MSKDSAASLVALMQASHTATLEELPGMIARHAAAAGMYDTAVFVVDLRGTVLRQLTGEGPGAGDGGQEFTVHGSLPGQAYQRVDLLAEPQPRGGCPRRRWWVAVTDGVERLGVLRADTDMDVAADLDAANGMDAAADMAPATDTDGVPDTGTGTETDTDTGPDPDPDPDHATDLNDEATRRDLRDLASMVALLLLSKRSFSDSFARLVRTEPMNVAAEMQWNLTPPPAYAGHDATVGAVMEPAYQVGGDAFDYAVAGHTLHLSVFDALGHDTTAGITASVAVAACRNARRQNASLSEISRQVEATLIQQFGTSRYVTGVLADLDLETGRFTWVNRGHHLPVLIRGNRWTTELPCPPAGPMGADLRLPVTEATEQLQPGDRLLLYTDGVVEARDARGRQFGRDRFVDFVLRHHSGGHTLHETLRRLMAAVLDHHDGRLDDDATVLLTEWRCGQQDLTP